MESEKQNFSTGKKEHDIIYSRAIKAGKRIYYLDVKLNRREEMFLSITESTKKIVGTQDDPQVTFEKHKIFLYNEDFDKFMEGLNEVMDFIRNGRELNADTTETNEEVSDNQDSVATDEEVRKPKSFLDKFRF
ncbi:MAG: DUF3276 family protein [Paludibacter sp.]|jgi:hypothetical protein|nr:DUF3276 family protein [Paludibacter sp.]MDD3488724.1 DUF3276 family protein [Paludibacter sp.]